MNTALRWKRDASTPAGWVLPIVAVLATAVAAACSGGVIEDVKKTVEEAVQTSAPGVSTFRLTSPTPTNASPATFDLVCVNASQYLVKEGAASPSATDPAWTSTKPASFPLAGEGTHSLSAWAKSASGAVSAAVAPLVVELDTTAPVISTFALTSATPTFDPLLAFSLAGSDGSGSGIEGWFLQSSSTVLPSSPTWLAASPLPSTFSINGATYGATTAVHVWAMDGAGNVGGPASLSVILMDSGIPSISNFTRTSPSPANSGTVTFTITPSTNATHLLFSESSTPPSSGDAGWIAKASPANSYVVTGDGSHSIYAWAKTQYGVVSAASAPITAVLDTGAPTITTFTLTSATPTFDPLLVFSLAGSDGTGSGIDGWFLQSGSSTLPPSPLWLSATPQPSTFSINGVAYGATTQVHVWVKDRAGNIGGPSSQSAVLMDSGLPTISNFVRASPSPANSGTVTFTIDPSTNATHLLFSESSTPPSSGDAGWIAKASSANSYVMAGEGSHSIYAWAKTQYGVVSAAIVPITAVLDTGAPTISTFELTSGTPATVSPALFNLQGSDAIGITGWLVKEGPASPAPTVALGDGGWTSGPIAPSSAAISSGSGDKYFYAFARDGAGNIGTATAPIHLVFQDSANAPALTNFTGPAYSTSMSISVTLTSNSYATAWVLRAVLHGASPTAPLPGDSDWTASAPSSAALPNSDAVYDLYAWAKNGAGQISSSRMITVTLDRAKPTLTGFTPANISTDSTTLSITPSGSDATSGIAAWALVDYTAIQTSPAAPGSGWILSSSPPTQCNLVSAPVRPHNVYVYVWARDAAGNVSDPLFITVDLRVTPAVQSLQPGTAIAGHEPITLVFNDAMSLGNFTIGGTLGALASPEMVGSTTLRLWPKPLWPSGSGTLTVSGTSSAGISMTAYSETLSVEYRVYVSPSGSDSSVSGGLSAPKLTVQSAIDLAVMDYRFTANWASSTPYAKYAIVKNGGNLYRCMGGGVSASSGGPSTTGLSIADGTCTWAFAGAYTQAFAADLVVATGTYTADYRTSGKPVASMSDGISLHGGYSPDFLTRNPTSYPTTLRDLSQSSVSEGLTFATANRAVQFVAPAGLAIGSATVLDGFTIEAGTNYDYCAALVCDGSAAGSVCSPTISNCTISGGQATSATKNSIGIVNNLASPSILGCRIDGKAGGVGNYGIYNLDSSPRIEGNSILGGTGGGDTTLGLTCGIWNAKNTLGSLPLILRNAIRANDSSAANKAYGIYCGSTCNAKIYDNTISGGTERSGQTVATFSTYGIWIQAASPDIRNNTIDAGSDPNTSTAKPACILIAGGASSQPLIENNLLFFRIPVFGYGIYEVSASTVPASFKNNDIFDCPSGLYIDEGATATPITGIAAVNALANASGNISTAQSTSIKVLTSQGANWTQQQASAWTLNATYVPTGDKTGGLDLSGAGLADFPKNPGGNPTDKTGSTARTGNGTTGWSMGAYELD